MRNSDSSLPMEFSEAWKWAAFVTILFLLNYMSRSTLSPVMVNLEHSLNVGHAQATSLLLAQGIGFAVAQATSGFLVGRVPPALVAGGSIVGAGFCLLCVYFVDNLTFGRCLFLLFGFMAGLYFPAGMATLGSLVRFKDWGKTVAIHELAPNVGFILIPLVAQAVLLFYDWRAAFMLMGFLCIAAGLLFIRFGRGGVCPTSPHSVKGSASLLRNPATWVISLLLTVTMCGEFSVFSVLQLFLVNEGGFTPERANTLLSLSRLGTPLAIILGGWAADKLPPRGILCFGLCLHALALGLMACERTDFVLTGACVQALSIALCFPSLFKAISVCYAMSSQPVLFSLTMPPAALISAGLMPWFFGLCGEHFSFGTGFLILGGISLLSVLSLPLLRPAAK